MNLCQTLIAAAAAGLVAVSFASAHPGKTDTRGAWRLDASRCPDLREDLYDRREIRRDERHDRGRRYRAEDRRDRLESRRDERVTVCPKSAWVWGGPRGYRTKRPAKAVIYYDPRSRDYYRFGPNRKRVHISLR